MTPPAKRPSFLGMSLSRPLLVALAVLGLAAPARAEEQPLAPRGDNMLRIPGMPPIPLPPGARAFGPPGVDDDDDMPALRRPAPALPRAEERLAAEKPKARAEKPRRAPASVPPVETRRAGLLDELFKQLRAAPDEEAARNFAAAIQRVWLRSGSDTADLLMGRAVQAMAGKDMKLAETVLDSVVGVEPGWAEGWYKRATVRFLDDDLAGAMTDLDRALQLEPRHFEALAGLGAILQKSGLDKRALEAYRRALEVYPEQPELKKQVEKLRLEVEGRDI